MTNEIEQAILGGIILDNAAIEVTQDIIKPSFFQDQNNKIIYENMLCLYYDKIPIDAVTLYQKLQKVGLLDQIGGAVYISQISQDISSSANIDYHCKVLFELFTQRKAYNYIDTIRARLDSKEDIFEILKDSSIEFERMADFNFVKDNNLIKELPRIINEIKLRKSGELDNSLKFKYFPTINTMTDSILPGNMIGIEARDKHGKTTLATNLTMDLAINFQEPVAIFSLENGIDELIWKIMSSETGVEYGKLRNPKDKKLSNQELEYLEQRIAEKFEDTNIFIYEFVENELEIKRTVKRLQKQYGLKWFVVDYIGILESISDEDTRERRIAAITRYFKNVAKELKVNPVLISQQNRMGDTAESLGIRRDCDFLFMVEKPYDLQRESKDFKEIKTVKINGSSFMPTANHYVVKFRRSRHSEQGGAFLCGYSGNKFRELDPESEQKFPDPIF